VVLNRWPIGPFCSGPQCLKNCTVGEKFSFIRLILQYIVYLLWSCNKIDWSDWFCEPLAQEVGGRGLASTPGFLWAPSSPLELPCSWRLHTNSCILAEICLKIHYFWKKISKIFECPHQALLFWPLKPLTFNDQKICALFL